MMDTAEEFMVVTGVNNAAEAKGWLEAANFDFEVAVNMFYSSTGYSEFFTLTEPTISRLLGSLTPFSLHSF